MESSCDIPFGKATLVLSLGATTVCILRVERQEVNNTIAIRLRHAKLLDKQNNIYTARSVAYLQEVTALPLDLSSLQDLILGNPVFLDSNIVSYTQTNEIITLLSTGDFFKNLFTVNKDSKLVQSSKLDDLDELRNRTCYIAYSDYENKENVNFATKRHITVTEKKKLDIKLDFKQYDFNETLSFPFSVPKNYKRN